MAEKKPTIDELMAAAPGPGHEIVFPNPGRYRFPLSTKTPGLAFGKGPTELQLETAGGAVMILPITADVAAMLYGMLGMITKEGVEAREGASKPPSDKPKH